MSCHGLVYVKRVAGLVEYRQAWAVQQRIAARVVAEAQAGVTPRHVLILLQHQPVYTSGLRSTSRDSSPEERLLRNLGASYVRSNRGGLITFHGPGQLTVYPVLHLTHMKRTLKWYVCALERTVIRACRVLGVDTHTSPHTGVWVNGENKICAIGIHGRHVTTHGFALNCCTDLTWFSHIVACGIAGKGVTSLSRELNRNVSVEEVVPPLLRAFSEVFECQLEDTEQEWTTEQFENA